MDILELRTPSTLSTELPALMAGVYSQYLDLRNQRVFKEALPSIPFPETRILRKWIPFCLSVDYDEQLGQVAMNGHVSDRYFQGHNI